MSYPNYLEDRRRLGFRCIADQNSSVVSDLKNVLKIAGKILVLYPIKKGKKIFVRIFSKETLIAGLLFVKAFYIDVDGNHQFLVTSPTYVTRLSNFQGREKYFKASSLILDSTLEFRGGSQIFKSMDEMNSKERNQMKKLINSIENAEQHPSLGKRFIRAGRKIGQFMNSLLSTSESSPTIKVMKNELDISIPLTSGGPVELEAGLRIQLHVTAKASSAKALGLNSETSRFADALPLKPQVIHRTQFLFSNKEENLNLGRLFSRKEGSLGSSENMNQTPNEDSSSNKLLPSGLSVNYSNLPQDLQEVEYKTRLRRSQPKSVSDVLKEPYCYSDSQVLRKARRYLTKDFGIDTNGKTDDQMIVKYRNEVEHVLKDPKIIVYKNATLNHQDNVTIFFQATTRKVVVFENKPQYGEEEHFVTSHQISPEAAKQLPETKNLGLSKNERHEVNNEVEKTGQKQSENKIKQYHIADI